MSKYFKYIPGAGTLGVCCVTIVFFILGVLNLGVNEIPSSDWQSGYNQDIRLDLGEERYADEVQILIQTYEIINVKAYSGYPENWTLCSSIEGEKTYRHWRELRIDSETRYIRLVFQNKPVDIGEIAVFTNGKRLNIERIVDKWDEEVAPQLIDEQSLVKHIPTYENGTFFDEVYFVQAAEDYTHLEKPYEWTHPPLGKLIIAAGMLALGNNPFAWRITGLLFATGAIPLMYLLTRRLFKNEWLGITASILLAVDFMHYTEARMGTGETFLFCFLMLMFFFFLRYLQTPPEESNGRDLFLSILFLGMAFTVKWTAIFAFIAIIILLVIFKRRFWLKPNELAGFLGGGLATMVIYIAAYCTYFINGSSLTDIIQLQFTMYGYHSGLEATHPYSSQWWSWPLMLRPVWLSTAEIDGLRSSILLFGNPITWWSAIIAIPYISWRVIKQREMNAAFIVIAFFALWLPYILISRALFIYHYYPAVLFVILSIVYCLNRIQRRWITISYVVLAILVFTFFFPVISGIPVWEEYWDKMRHVMDWGIRIIS